MRPLSELAPMTTACFCSNTLTPRCSGRSQKPLDNKADLVYVSFSEEVIAPLLVNQPPPVRLRGGFRCFLARLLHFDCAIWGENSCQSE